MARTVLRRGAPENGAPYPTTREHWVRDVTFGEDLSQKTRTGNQPNAHAGIRNLVMGAFRRKGHADTAAARRYYGRDDQRILALYGYR